MDRPLLLPRIPAQGARTAATLQLRAGGLEVRRPLRVGIIASAPGAGVGRGDELAWAERLSDGLTAAGCEVVQCTTAEPGGVRSGMRALGKAGGPDELGWIARAYRALSEVDVVHDQTTAGPEWAVTRSHPAPVVTTLRDPFTPQVQNHCARLAALGAHVVVTSRYQSSIAPLGSVTAVIRDGLDLDEVPVGTGDGGYVIFAGRMDHAGGADRAVHVARAAGLRILLLGAVERLAERQYFDQVLAPLLGRDARHLDPPTDAERLRLFGGAVAVLNPITCADPFASALIEALATGTPVLSYDEGAAAEVVEHGRTGFLCADEEEMTLALTRVATIDRRVCRARAAARFSIERATSAHLALYQRVIARRNLGAVTTAEAASAASHHRVS